MNRITTILIALLMQFFFIEASAQKYLNVYTTDNQKHEYLLSNIKEVVVMAPEYVDLDLPSKTKWATFNVGATSPEDYGSYYSWGETETKSQYGWTTYMVLEASCGTSSDPLVNYVYPNRNSIAGTNYDVATKLWGSKWKMPTKAQFAELVNTAYTSYVWTTVNGVYGMKITSKKNGKSIFLPAAGGWDITLGSKNSYGYYWVANSTSATKAKRADYYYFYSGGIYTSDINRRWGYSIRPVYSE